MLFGDHTRNVVTVSSAVLVCKEVKLQCTPSES